MKSICKALSLLLLAASGGWAFPPAPYYTLYGIVRDQVGQAIGSEGAVLVLFKGGVEVGRTPVNPSLGVDQNYELKVRIDHNRSGTALYNEKAIAAEGLFSVVVEMNGERFLPIEAAGSLTAGKGSERVRLDMNLGVDSDHDGLPDIWEEWQLHQAGYQPDAAGQWPIHLIDHDGDLDGDGTSNWLEYLAGTFAGDATEKFGLAIKEKLATTVRLEFYAITGKTYTIESSPDLATWTRVPFSVDAPAAGNMAYIATNVGVLSVFTPPAPDGIQEFYRLSVR